MKNRILQYKILLLIFAALLLLFLCGDFGVPAISETAVITAVGVENGDNGNFRLTFMLAGVDENGGKKSSVITTFAKTVAGGVEQLESGFGLSPKLAYTSLVLAGEDIASGDIFDVISFFLNTSGVHDSAKLMVATSPVSEIFQAIVDAEKAGTGGLSSVISAAEKTPLTIPQINLKDFAEIYFSQGHDAALVAVGLEKTAGQTTFDLGSACLYTGDKITSKINGDMILAFNICKGAGKGGSFTIEGVNLSDCVSDIRLSVADVSCKLKKSLSLGEVKVTAKVKMKVGLLDQSNSSKTLAQISGVGADKEIISAAAASYIKENITRLFAISFAENSDIFGIGETLAITDRKAFESAVAASPDYLKNAFSQVSVEVEVLQNHRL